MTDLVKIALIAATPPTIAAIGSLVVSLRANKRVAVVEKAINGHINDQNKLEVK